MQVKIQIQIQIQVDTRRQCGSHTGTHSGGHRARKAAWGGGLSDFITGTPTRLVQRIFRIQAAAQFGDAGPVGAVREIERVLGG